MDLEGSPLKEDNKAMEVEDPPIEINIGAMLLVDFKSRSVDLLKIYED